MQKLKATLGNPAWICFTWFGVTAGVSLLATPLRFSAPTVTRAIGLDIGRVVFTALNKLEIVALIILLVVVRVSGRARIWWGICATLVLIVMLQSVWLLPELSERARMIVSGVEPPASYLHALYSTSELCKLGLLLLAGFVALGEKAER
ncbi:MAG TPA: hypothetical protein PKK10_06265 [Woeseiaceae bacterium]|nr:hypothetical protein [Woeseiaceae bacterium]